MIRPDFGELIVKLFNESKLVCPQCNRELLTRQQVKKHWSDGHFDYPEVLGVHVNEAIKTSDKVG